MTADKSVGYALFALRVTMFGFMTVWALRKITNPGSYEHIFGRFYGLDVGTLFVYGVGGLQIILLILFLIGAIKFVSYGAVLLMNLASMVVSVPDMLGGKLLFIAAIPVFGASLASFLMRKHDTFLAVQKS